MPLLVLTVRRAERSGDALEAVRRLSLLQHALGKMRVQLAQLSRTGATARSANGAIHVRPIALLESARQRCLTALTKTQHPGSADETIDSSRSTKRRDCLVSASAFSRMRSVRTAALLSRLLATRPSTRAPCCVTRASSSARCRRAAVSMDRFILSPQDTDPWRGVDHARTECGVNRFS
jgi:hypothetical protein